MNDILENRAVKLAEYIINNKKTVRATAQKFGVSKSTVHKDVSSRLKLIDLSLYKEVMLVLQENKAQRHIRGGLATKEKYAKLVAQE